MPLRCLLGLLRNDAHHHCVVQRCTFTLSDRNIDLVGFYVFESCDETLRIVGPPDGFTTSRLRLRQDRVLTTVFVCLVFVFIHFQPGRRLLAEQADESLMNVEADSEGVARRALQVAVHPRCEGYSFDREAESTLALPLTLYCAQFWHGCRRQLTTEVQIGIRL